MNPILIRSRWIPAVVFVGITCLGLCLVHLDFSGRQAEHHRVTHEVLSAHAIEVGHILSNALSAIHLIEQEITTHQGRLDHLNTLPDKILQQFPGISTVRLLPEGTIPLSYSAIRVNGLTHSKRLPETSTNITSNHNAEIQIATLEGPILLPDGNYIFRGYNPVFFSRHEKPYFWGTAAVEIHLDDLLAASGFPEMVEQGYYYELTNIGLNSTSPRVISTSNTARPNNLISMKIFGPTNNLQLTIGYTRGIFEVTPFIGILIALALALSLALLCRKMMTEPEKLRTKVASQTKDLRTLAYTDSLTNLANRKGFTDHLKVQIRNHQCDLTGVALLMFDLDDFKMINDTMGHPTGDELLVGIADRVAAVIPENARLARLGGDEFTVTFSGPNIQQQTEITANRIKSCFNHSFKTRSNQIYSSASIGYAILSHDIDTAEKLLVAADQALYHAKKSKGKSICDFTNDMLESARRKQILMSDLRDAIKNDQLEVLYQPIVCTVTTDVRKAEALLRWNHPAFGIISPLEFIPIAEQTGLIEEIGHWVFTQASSQVKIWREQHAPDFQVSINVSPIQFNTGTLAKNWINHLQMLDLPGSSILLEITENMLMQNCSSTQQQLNLLRQSGIEVALDDFGTGYSSLSYLRNFNIDYVKIDRSFINNVTKIENDKIVCNGIIAIATQLGLKVVGEGIETDDQRHLMIELGCHLCQGYLFSKPISVQAFKAKYLHRHQQTLTSVETEAA